MDSSFLLIVAVVALGVWRFIARRRRKRERQQDDKRWAELTKRVYQLESSLQELRNGIAVRKTPSSTRPVRADDVTFTAISTAPSSVGKSSEGTTEVAPLALGEAQVPRPIFRRRCERQEPAGNGENTGCLRLCKTIPPKDCAKMS